MSRQYNRTMAVAVAAALAAPLAHADNFTTEGGLQGRWSLNASVGTNIRMTDADKNLIAVVNGGTAGAGADDGNLNFKKHDAYSTVGKLIGELELKGDTYGVFLRGFAWYDWTLKGSGVEHGSFNNAYVPGAKLSDEGFDRLSTFDGAALADAYVFANYDLGGKPINIKLGNQVINWGESLFVPGINAMGPIDLNAARRPGAQVKEILRPQPALMANLGFGNGLSVEAFYTIQWKQSVVDGCGTYWSVADSLNCNNGTLLFGDGTKLNDRGQYNGAPLLAGLPAALDPLLASLGLSRSMPLNFRIGTAQKIEPKNSGQFGLSSHYFADPISTDFGLYFARYNSHMPIVSTVKQPTPLPSVWSGKLEQLAKLAPPAVAAALGSLGRLSQGNIVWDYSGEDVKTLGLSAATEVGGFSLFGEVSRTQDIPVQINAIDMLVGTVLGIGPQAKLASIPRDPSVPVGTVIHGYDRKDKTQLQMSFIRLIPQVLGADSVNLLGEVAVQKWSGIGDPNTSTRYGRGFAYNFAPTPALGNTCPAAIQPNASYCENQGFATPSAWGYRLAAEFLYPNVVAGINLKPRLYFAHDVHGYAADNLFVQDRQTRSIGLRGEYNSRYYADVSYTAYNKNAKYDQFHDHDFMSFVVGVNF